MFTKNDIPAVTCFGMQSIISNIKKQKKTAIVFVLIVVLLTSKSSHKHRFVHRRDSIVQLVRAPIRFALWHKFDSQH